MNKNIDVQKLRDQISKGLVLTFQKLIKQKKAQNGVFILSEKGQIKKIKASELSN